MRKLKKYIMFILVILFLTGCDKEYKINQEIILKGKVITREITENNQTYKVNILNLDEPIIIDGTKIKKLELDYDKDLKNDTEITIKGTIKNNAYSNIDTSYSFSVTDVDDILSFINTFSNNDFSMTIPVEIIKSCSIERINNGFIIYGSNEKKESTEVFRIISITNKDFLKIQENLKSQIEKVVSNKEKTIVIIYKNDTDLSEVDNENYDSIIKQIDNIKNTVKLK